MGKPLLAVPVGKPVLAVFNTGPMCKPNRSAKASADAIPIDPKIKMDRIALRSVIVELL